MTTQSKNALEDLHLELATLEAQQMRRQLRPADQTEDGRIRLQGKTLLNFSSNDYLGLSRHPSVIEAVKQAAERWGAGAGSSRLISGTMDIHRQLELALADFMQTEAALVFPTGYMANVGVITALVQPGDAVVADRLCHASIIDAVQLSGARLFIYAHRDVEQAEKALRRASGYRRRLLITESLFSMDGDFAPLAELAVLADRCGAISMVDEAHAIGVWGTNGRGYRFESAGGHWDIVVGTLSKALGSQGGFVCGSQTLIETLINRARSFIYTTGLSPTVAAAAQAALVCLKEEPMRGERVRARADELRRGLKDLGIDTLDSESQIVPALLGSVGRTLACAAELEAAGIYAPAIRPPTVRAGQCRLRFSVTSEHSSEDIGAVLRALREWRTRS